VRKPSSLPPFPSHFFGEKNLEERILLNAKSRTKFMTKDFLTERLSGRLVLKRCPPI